MSLKHRLVGASVVIAGMIIFLPVLIDSEKRDARPVSTEIELPPSPNYDFEEQTLPKPNQFDFRASESEPEVTPEAPIEPRSPVDFEQPVEVPPEAFEGFSAPDVPAKIQPAPAPRPISKPTPAKSAKPIEPPKPASSAPTPKTATPSNPPKPSPAIVGSVWVVQVGSFSRSDNAIELSDRLRKKGYSAFVERVGGPVEPAHRVKVGAESTRGGADALRQELTAKEGLTGFVTRHP